VCAHRYAYETATSVTFIGQTNQTTVRVATVESLIAMKAHALRFGRPTRRATKRASDLYDIIRLTTVDAGRLLSHAPWGLREQTHDALSQDLADLPAASAVLARSAIKPISEITPELLRLVVENLIGRLAD